MNWQREQQCGRRGQAGWQGESGFLGPPRPEARPAFKRQSPVALRVLPFVACSKSFTSMNPPHSFLSCFPVYSCCIYFCHSSLKKQGLLAPLSRFTKQNEGQNLSVSRKERSGRVLSPLPQHPTMLPSWHSFHGCALQLDTLWLLGREKQILFIQKVPFLPRGSIKAVAHLGGPCGGQLSVLAAGSKCGLS